MEQKKIRRETRNLRCIRILGALFMSVVLALSIFCFVMPLYAFIQFRFAFGVLEAGGLTYVKPGCWLIMVASILSILLCVGLSAAMAIWSPRLMLVTYLVLLLVSFAFITSGGLALYSWSQYGGWGTPPSIQFTQSIVQALTSNYGEVGFDTWTADVDQTQAYFGCCGFNKDGWQDYRSSQWFAQSSGVYGYDKLCVPESCCAMNQFGSYNNLNQCQVSWDIGPCQAGGYGNPPLYYSGCLGSLSWVMTQFVVPMGGVAPAVGGIVLLFVIGFIVLPPNAKSNDFKENIHCTIC